MLTDRQIKNLTPTDGKKKVTIGDNTGNGLCVIAESRSKGVSRYFTMRYSFNGRQQNIHLGTYPKVSLIEARRLCDQYREGINKGIDPRAAKLQGKQKQLEARENTFAAVSERWLSRYEKGVATKTAGNNRAILKNHITPFFGNTPIREIAKSDIAKFCETLEEGGLTAQIQKALQTLSMVFDFAAVSGLIEVNIVRGVNWKTLLTAYNVQHQPTIKQDEITDFFKAFITAGGEAVTRYALLLLILTAQRNEALRLGRWENIDFAARIWRFPMEDMKQTAANRGRKGEFMTIPLSDWMLELLTDLKELTGNTPYLFPASRRGGGKSEILSMAAIGRLIDRMGYDGKHKGKSKAVPHGFRSFMAGVCQEAGYEKQLIDHALAHEQKGVDKSYFHETLLERRREMMDFYSNWLKERYNQAEKEIAENEIARLNAVLQKTN